MISIWFAISPLGETLRSQISPWLFNKFSLSVPKEMYRRECGEFGYWSMLGCKGLSVHQARWLWGALNLLFFFIVKVPPSAPPASLNKSLSEIKNVDEVQELSVKELKCILRANFVDFTGCCEKEELLERVRTLWNSKQEYIKKKSKYQDHVHFSERIFFGQHFLFVFVERGFARNHVSKEWRENLISIETADTATSSSLLKTSCDYFLKVLIWINKQYKTH